MSLRIKTEPTIEPISLGTVKKGNEVGKRNNNKHIYHACVDCGKARWVKMVHGQAENILFKMEAYRI